MASNPLWGLQTKNQSYNLHFLNRGQLSIKLWQKYRYIIALYPMEISSTWILNLAEAYPTFVTQPYLSYRYYWNSIGVRAILIFKAHKKNHPSWLFVLLLIFVESLFWILSLNLHCPVCYFFKAEHNRPKLGQI